MKKILMLLSNPFKPDPRVYKEAKSLVHTGFHVEILCWDRSLEYPEEEVKDGVKIERIRIKSGYGFKNMVFNLPLFWGTLLYISMKKDFDFIHTHDFDTAFIGFLMKIIKGKRWVYDSHDIYPTFLMKNCKETITSKIMLKLDIFFAKYCDQLIVPTHSIVPGRGGQKEYYRMYNIEEEKVKVLWNVPEVKEFLNYQKLNLNKSDRLTIGFIGGQRTVKNFLTLFESIKEEKDKYKILFVGEGKDTLFLKEFIAENYADLDIEFIKNVDYKLIPNYYRLCDCIFSVYKSRKETLCDENEKRAIQTKVFESAALGVPSLVPEYNLSGDFVKKYGCGVIIKKLTPEEIRSALQNLRNLNFNPEKIIPQWNWENETRKLVEIYEKLSGGDL